MEVITIRIEKTLKDKAQKSLKKMGLSLSAATRLFLMQVVKEKNIPFNIKN